MRGDALVRGSEDLEESSRDPAYFQYGFTTQGFIMRVSLNWFRFVLTFFLLNALCQAGPSAADCIENTWQQMASLPGPARDAAASFSMNGKGYVAGGFSSSAVLSDFWEYDPAANAWTQKADVPFKDGVSGMVGFSLNGFGYLVISAQAAPLRVYKYDPNANTWTQMKTFPGPARDREVVFVSNGKAFLGLGATIPAVVGPAGLLSDFWAYDPVADVWQPAPAFPAAGRSDATAFSLNDVGFVGLGNTYNSPGGQQDFWTFSNGSWQQLGNFPGPISADTVSFSVGPKGYLGTGTLGGPSASTTSFWEYTPETDTWKQKADFGGQARLGAIGFSIDTKGYIGTGLFVTNANPSSAVWDSDLWSFCTGLACIAPPPPVLAASYPPNICTGTNGGFLLQGLIGDTLNVSVNGAPYYSGPSPFPGSVPSVPGTAKVTFSQTAPGNCQSPTQTLTLTAVSATATPAITTKPNVCTVYNNTTQTESAQSTVTCTNCIGNIRYILDNKIVATTTLKTVSAALPVAGGAALVGPHKWLVEQVGPGSLCTPSAFATAPFNVLECVLTGR